MKSSTEETSRIKIGCRFLCSFLLGKQKKGGVLHKQKKEVNMQNKRKERSIA